MSRSGYSAHPIVRALGSGRDYVGVRNFPKGGCGEVGVGGNKVKGFTSHFHYLQVVSLIAERYPFGFGTLIL